MKTAKLKSLMLAGVALVFFSLATLANAPQYIKYPGNNIAPQDTARTAAKMKHRKRPHTAPVNRSSTGNKGGDINDAGSPAEVRNERTGSLNPYSYGTVKSHEQNTGTTGPTGK